MGVGLNVHIECLKSPQSWPVPTCCHHGQQPRTPEHHCNPLLLALLLRLYQGLDSTIPKTDALPPP